MLGAQDNSGELKLSFAAVQKDDFIRSYILVLKNKSDEIIMKLQLTADLVEATVLNSIRPESSMSPDGEVSVELDSHDALFHSNKGVAIDDLVVASLRTPMLEDEANIVQLLQTLHDRLRRALLAVEAAQNQLK